MHLVRPIAIDLREFFRSGRFDYLEVGQTQEWIIHNFPDPDDFDPADLSPPDGRGMSIWRYGNLELHFEGPRLYLIFSDYLDHLDGGPSLALDPWLVGDPAQRSLLAMMRALNAERIDFRKQTGAHDNLTLDLASGVTLHFDADDEADPNAWRLSAFALMRPPVRP